MHARKLDELLTRRERQAMEVLWRTGASTVRDVYDALPDAPSYNAVRSTLNILEDKGHVERLRSGRRFVYRPLEVEQDRRSALRNLVETLFDGSREAVVSALYEGEGPTEEALQRLRQLVDEAEDA